MKTSRLLGGCALLVVVGFAARASAQGVEEQVVAAPTAGDPGPMVGDPGHWTLSLERAFGFDYLRESESVGGISGPTNSFTTLSLFGNPPVAALTGFTFPRVAFDYAIAPNVTLGTALGFGYGSETQAGTSASFTSVVAAPRVGYAAHLSPGVVFWPRAGLSVFYASISPNGGGSSSVTLFAATIDAPFVISVAPHVGISLGPTFDITFHGNASVSGAYGGSADVNVLEFGAQAGLVVTL
jgi:hypothetical protein